jgi:hypothetical protein
MPPQAGPQGIRMGGGYASRSFGWWLILIVRLATKHH